MPYEISPDDNGSRERSLKTAVARGWRQQCPACGKARLYGRFLKVVPNCESCGTTLDAHRADDAPPYFTMTIVGHIVVAGVLIVERRYHPDAWIHAAIFLPMTFLLSLWLLPRIKGMLIGQQWALRMHGFSESGAPDPAAPRAWPGLKAG